MWCQVWASLIQSGSTAKQLRHVERLLDEVAVVAKTDDVRELVEELSREVARRIALIEGA